MGEILKRERGGTSETRIQEIDSLRDGQRFPCVQQTGERQIGGVKKKTERFHGNSKADQLCFTPRSRVNVAGGYGKD